MLTNAHVITTAGQGTDNTTTARTVYVEFADGDRVTAKIVGSDLFDDVGVLRVDPKQHALDPVPLGDSSRVVVGQPVAAIGSPFGNTDSLSVGVVSAIRRSIPSLTSKYDLVDAIQTDAPINHGNSGGPLFDARGRVIGINAQIRSSGTTSGFEGVGFAVPIDSARRSHGPAPAHRRRQVRLRGDQDRGPDARDRAQVRVRGEAGRAVDVVNDGSAAAKAGIQAGTRDGIYEGIGVKVGGDAIVAIDGIPVTNAQDVVRIVTTKLVPGESSRFTLVRGSQRRVVTVTLAARPSPN